MLLSLHFPLWFAISACSGLQVVLSTARPAKFAEAVTRALSAQRGFDFGRDVIPQEFRGLSEKEKNDIDVGKPTEEELVKNVVENRLAMFRSV